MIRHRFEIINHLIQINNYKSYLEIGTYIKDHCFNKVQCEKKICVDPAKNNQVYDFNMTSDEFFSLNKDTFDIIFIDGLHTAEQSYNDIINALSILNHKGSIIVHDTNPKTEFHATDTYHRNSPSYPEWNGSVWKGIFKLRTTRKDLTIRTYPSDHGVTIITKEPSDVLVLDNEFYSYKIFDANRKSILNFIEQ